MSNAGDPVAVSLSGTVVVDKPGSAGAPCPGVARMTSVNVTDGVNELTD